VLRSRLDSSFSDSDELSSELVSGTTVSSFRSCFFTFLLLDIGLLPLVELAERESEARRRLLVDRERRGRLAN